MNKFTSYSNGVLNEAKMTPAQIKTILARFEESSSRNAAIGLIWDCALDNAGFDGRSQEVFTKLNDADRKEIFMHIDGIIDGQMVSSVHAKDYAQAQKMLKP